MRYDGRKSQRQPEPLLSDINSRAFVEEILPSGEGECVDLGTGFGLIDQTVAKDRSNDLHSMGFDGFSVFTFQTCNRCGSLCSYSEGAGTQTWEFLHQNSCCAGDMRYRHSGSAIGDVPLAVVGNCGFYRTVGCGDTECLSSPASVGVICFRVDVVNRDNREPTADKFGGMIGQAPPKYIHLVLVFVSCCKDK